MAEICIVCEAVSYTHLDVYKRQVHKRLMPFGLGQELLILTGCDNHGGFLAADGDQLRARGSGASDDFAKSGFGVLQLPALQLCYRLGLFSGAFCALCGRWGHGNGYLKAV